MPKKTGPPKNGGISPWRRKRNARGAGGATLFPPKNASVGARLTRAKKEKNFVVFFRFSPFRSLTPKTAGVK
jgi:hypothetical protein